MASRQSQAPLSARTDVSIILATHRRRAVVEHTLRSIRNLDLEGLRGELIVVDNDSRDGTRELAESMADRCVGLRRNHGSCAKAYGVPHATGRYILFLDDDAVPRPGAILRWVQRMDADQRLACAGFSVHLPDGRQEASALPGVFVGCGVGLRASALRAVGGLDRFLFMQAEEFDLCFRLVERGWKVGVFQDLIVDHLKTPRGRRSRRTLFLDTRNNLIVADRYLPEHARATYRRDWLGRYRWMASAEGSASAVERGRRAAQAFSRSTGRVGRSRLSARSFELFFRWDDVAARMDRLAGMGFRRLLLADLGKNAFPFVRGARRAGLDIVAISDDRFAGPGRTYHGTSVVLTDQAVTLRYDAVIIANMAGALAEATAERWRRLTDRPVLDWYSPATVIDPFDAGDPRGSPTRNNR